MSPGHSLDLAYIDKHNITYIMQLFNACGLKYFRSVRHVTASEDDKLISDEEVSSQLLHFLHNLDASNKTTTHHQFPSQPGSKLPRQDIKMYPKDFHDVRWFRKTINHSTKNENAFESKMRRQYGDRDTYIQGLNCMKESLRFTIERGESTLASGGCGVLVKSGTIPHGTVVAFYPG